MKKPRIVSVLYVVTLAMVMATLVVAFSNLRLFVAGKPKIDESFPTSARVAAQPPKLRQKPDPIRKNLKSNDPAVRLAAIEALSNVPPEEAAPAVPDLIAALRIPDEHTRLNAALVLAKIGKPAVPSLVSAIKSNNADVRFYALSALGWIGSAASDANSAIHLALNDSEAANRRKAAEALGRIGCGGPETIAALIKIFEEEGSSLARAAVEAVSRFGAPAVEPLRIPLKHPLTRVRAATVDCLGRLGAQAEPAVLELVVPLLIDGLKDQEPRVRSIAVRALTKFGPTASAAVPELTRLLEDPDDSMRQLARKALAKIQR